MPYEDYSEEIRAYTEPGSKEATALRESFQQMADLLMQHVEHRLPVVERGVNDPPLGEATHKAGGADKVGDGTGTVVSDAEDDVFVSEEGVPKWKTEFASAGMASDLDELGSRSRATSAASVTASASASNSLLSLFAQSQPDSA